MQYKNGTIIILFILVMVMAIKPVKGAPDEYYYYLEGGNRLTTTHPEDPYIEEEISWGTTYSDSFYLDITEGTTIERGTYTFVFWLKGPGAVSVTFEFGYNQYKLVKVTESFWNLGSDYSRYTLSGDGEKVVIPAGSKLYLYVWIENMQADSVVYFAYSGSTYDTHIKTPSIIVPEFPVNVFLLPPTLLALYLILRRRLLKIS